MCIVGAIVGGPMGGVAAVCEVLSVAAVSTTAAGCIGGGTGAVVGLMVNEDDNRPSYGRGPVPSR